MIRLLLSPLRQLRTLSRNRFLLAQMVRRVFVARHAGAVLGWLWSFVATVIQFAILFVVFSVILGIRIAEPAGVNFGVYLMTGLVPFLALNDVLIRAAGLFRANAPLVQRVRFPAEVLVVGDTMGTMLHQALAFGVVVAACALLGHLQLSAIPWLLGGVVLMAMWCVGIAELVSVGGAFLPDIGHGLGVGLQLVFYGAPIVYPISMIPSSVLCAVIEANPLSVMIAMIRTCLLGADPPGWVHVALLTAGGLFLLILGAATLDRWRLRVPDVV